MPWSRGAVAVECCSYGPANKACWQWRWGRGGKGEEDGRWWAPRGRVAGRPGKASAEALISWHFIWRAALERSRRLRRRGEEAWLPIRHGPQAALPDSLPQGPRTASWEPASPVCHLALQRVISRTAHATSACEGPCCVSSRTN